MKQWTIFFENGVMMAKSGKQSLQVSDQSIIDVKYLIFKNRTPDSTTFDIWRIDQSKEYKIKAKFKVKTEIYTDMGCYDCGGDLRDDEHEIKALDLTTN